MSKIANEYWDSMNEFKAHCHYVHGYLIRSERWNNRIEIYLAITSSVCIGGWAIWAEFSFLWGFLIALSQVLNAAKSYLPFSKRIKPLRNLSYAFDELFIDMEDEWYCISEGDLTVREIHAKTIEFKRRIGALWKRHIGELTIPHNDKLLKNSTLIAKEYFLRK
ncbi:hypothetical protein QEH57_16375 [Pelagicoccus sp. SDUM812005]|nr:hypothetical protein [Pelagicoccus sp. SDUM812005]